MSASSDETAAAIDAALEAIDAADIRAGMTAVRDMSSGLRPGSPELAERIGRESLRSVGEAFDLDVGVLLDRAQQRGTLQADLLVRTLGVVLNDNARELVRGACQSGILSGVRLGLLIADARARDAGS